MKKIWLLAASISLILALLITGCSGSTTSSTPATTTAAVTTTAGSTTTTTAATITAATTTATTAVAPATAGTTPAASTPAATGNQKSGGVLKIQMSASPVQLGYTPALVASEFSALSSCFEYLIGMKKDGSLAPQLATKWEVDPAGKFVTITLRQGVKFHDGTVFDAEAAKYNIDVRLKAIPGEIPGLTSCDVVDPYTIKLNVSQYTTPLLPALNVVKMSSPTWLKSAGEQGAREKPVGTGPFKFAEFKRDAYLKFERFDDYWGGKPHLDGVQYVFIPDAMIAQASFIAGEVDVLQNADVKTASDLSAKGYKAVSIIGGLTGLAPDFGRAGSIFTDIKVRQAIEYAIDKEAIVDTLGKGYFEAIYQFNAAGFQGYNPAIEGRKYDPDKAKALLTEAGHPDGISTTIYAIEMFAPRDAMASIQAYLADANINAKVEFVDVGRWNELRRKSGWDGLLFMHSGWSTNVPMMINYPLSKPRNDYVSAPRTDECEALLQKMLVTTDYNAQSAVLQQIEKLLYDQAWACPLWGRTATAVINDKKVHDSGINDFSVIDWTPALAWLGE